jgi:Flp pilus assembly pilin Flp
VRCNAHSVTGPWFVPELGGRRRSAHARSGVGGAPLVARGVRDASSFRENLTFLRVASTLQWRQPPPGGEPNMKKLLARFRRQSRALVKDDRGANMVEYMIIVGVVALLSIVAFTEFGSKVQEKIKDEGGKVSGIKTG